MTHPGYAPTQDIPQVPVLHRATAAAVAVPATIGPGTPVTYLGSSLKDHGCWISDGPCPCGCGGLRLWRREADGLHRLVHVSAASVTRGVRP